MPAKPEQIAAYSLLGIAFIALAGGFILLNLPAAPPPQLTGASRPALSPAQAARHFSPTHQHRHRKTSRIHTARPKPISEEERYTRAQSTEVWAETRTHHYYLTGSPQYGNTRGGVYMSLEDAQRLGYVQVTE